MGRGLGICKGRAAGKRLGFRRMGFKMSGGLVGDEAARPTGEGCELVFGNLVFPGPGEEMMGW